MARVFGFIGKIFIGIALLLAAGCATEAVIVPPAQAPVAVPTASPTPVQPTPVLPQSQPLPSPTSPAPTPTPTPPPRLGEWKLVVSGLTRPVDLAYAGDVSGRLYVLEQPGRVRVIQDNRLDEKVFLDITSKVGSKGNEQGLLGIAFPKDYSKNGNFYLYYTNLNGDSVVSRFRAAGDFARADPASEQVLLTFKQPFPNHNGGGLVFGPDGYLYIGSGDGGSAGDPQGNGQSLNTLLGKLLRIDVSGTGAYQIPNGNPFKSGGGRPEIWAYGLRNPWRFSFDSQTGDLYIADVGQNKYEEINFLPAGAPARANFGWVYREGAHPFKGTPPENANLIDPVWEYGRDQGCSVTGGFVYRGSAIAELRGVYLFGDYCNGLVWGLSRSGGSWKAERLFDTDANISSFGVDEKGELYLLDLRSGSVFRLEK